MNKFLRAGGIAVIMLSIAACGGSGHVDVGPRTIFVAKILSDQPADGDIAFDSVQQTFTITNGPETLFFGIDDLNPDHPEYRAFLDFPLDGSTGGDIVPANAVIVSATLELFINEVSFANVVPAFLDLAPYSITGLRTQDFDSPPLVSETFNFFASDQGNFVAIDVTQLMQEAQRRGLSDFQVRFLLDFALSDIGFVGIEDLRRVAITAPLLTVKYE